jgi:pyridoxal phosphate enzyme (YggS family)
VSIAENLQLVRTKISEAALRVGRDPAEVQLVAVSKRQPIEAIREAYEAGQRHFGENYVQELSNKRQALSELSDIRWHFIGHLQRNKVRHLIGAVDLIQTIDSERLLDEVDKRAAAGEIGTVVLLQVNIGEEESKSGCSPHELPRIIDHLSSTPWVNPRGLMVIPPYELDAEDTREYFRALRELGVQLGGDGSPPQLSMGMSHDFEVAVEEGATFVRVGTSIFGPRMR